VAEHRLKQVKGFTKKYEVDRLVYFEQFDERECDPAREAIKKLESSMENPADRGAQSQLG